MIYSFGINEVKDEDDRPLFKIYAGRDGEYCFSYDKKQL